MRTSFWVEVFIPIFFIFIELAVSVKTRWKHYDWIECLSSIIIRAIVYLMVAVYASAITPLFQYVWKFRIIDWKLDALSQAFVFFFANEFLFYVSHVFAHKVSIGWGNHATHHTMLKFNIISGLRGGATGPFALYSFFPLLFVWLGFHPTILNFYILLGFNLNLLLHTETISKLGFIEGIINTPSSHRVHHGTQNIYVNKNFGAITLIFDRLFGTYQEELKGIPPNYGLAGETIPSQNPLRLVLIGWEILFKRCLKQMQKSFALVVMQIRKS